MLAAGLQGCDNSGPKVEQVAAGPRANADAAELNSGTGSGACKVERKEDCAKIEMDVYSDGFANTLGLLGYVGEPVPWNFRGVATGSSDRMVGVLLNNFPSEATIDPPISTDAVHSEVKIVWTPDAKRKSTDKLQIYLRDMDRCIVNIGKEKCHNGKKSQPEYDQLIELSWQIESREELEDLANNNNNVNNDTVVPTPSPSCQPSNPLGTIVGVLTGNGGNLPQLIPGLLSSLGNNDNC